MSGILDNKKRVLDVLLTSEGRKQIADGGLRIESYTFTDVSTFYRPDSISGSLDATNRLYFEASNLPQDSITFESNSDGRLNPFKSELGTRLRDGQIVEYSTTGSSVLTGPEFSEAVDSLLDQSLDNFKKLRIISNKDDLFDDNNFGVGNSSIEFVITDSKPLKNGSKQVFNINNEESLFSDPRFSNALNFKYLPPINKTTDDSLDKTDHRSTKNLQLGNYPRFSNFDETLTYKMLNDELTYFENLGYSKIVRFEPTSSRNNLMIQIFEKNHNQVSKMNVVDFGTFITERKTVARVFFVGKLLVDDFDNHTFIHIFSVIFE